MKSHVKRIVVGLLTFAGVVTAGHTVFTDSSRLGAQSVAPGTVLLRDDFNDGAADGWTSSPLGLAAGWNVVAGAYTYDGGGHTQVYRGDPSWSDYTLEVKFRLTTLNNYPGGIRGRVNPDTGAGYAVWVYPETGQIRLVRATEWRIDAPGLTVLGMAGGLSFEAGAFHMLHVTFVGSVIEVYYDGLLVIRATDTAAYASGLIALDVSNQPIAFDDVAVTAGALSELLRDDFSSSTASGWTISPLGQPAGWSVVAAAYTYGGNGHTQSYRGDPSWSDYTLEVKFRLSTLNDYPGGIRGRVDPATGAGYAVWVYPATGEMRLLRASGWNIDSPGLAVLGVATGIAFDTATFHALRMTFWGSVVDVYYDGLLVIRVSDPAYRTGVIALDVSSQPIAFDDVVVTYGVLPVRFPSAERGCDGSDPSVVMCDDFEDGAWYRTNCDNGGVTDPANDGWCGNVFNPIDPPAAAVCGSAGAVGTQCAATSGFKSGQIGGQNMADHSFKNWDEYTEIYARYYYKAAPGYVWGWEKAMTWNQCCAGIGGIKWGNLHFPCNAAASCAPSFQLVAPELVMQGQNQGNTLEFQPGRWYFIEIHVRLSTPVAQPDGVLEMWLDDCGTDGLQCTGTPTLRLRRTDVRYDRNSSLERIGSLWWENWANPPSVGTEYYDQIKVATVGPIGFAR